MRHMVADETTGMLFTSDLGSELRVGHRHDDRHDDVCSSRPTTSRTRSLCHPTAACCSSPAEARTTRSATTCRTRVGHGPALRHGHRQAARRDRGRQPVHRPRRLARRAACSSSPTSSTLACGRTTCRTRLRCGRGTAASTRGISCESARTASRSCGKLRRRAVTDPCRRITRNEGPDTCTSSASIPRSASCGPCSCTGPDRSLERLTPHNRTEFLFDDVVWVERARREHDAFTDVLRDRGVEVLYLEDLLAETLAHSDEARRHIVERAVSSYTVGLSLVDELRAYLFAQDAGAARRDARRRPAHLRARGPRPRVAQPPLARRGARRAGHLRPAAAAQHDVHARLERVALRRRRAAAAVLARAPARGRQRLGDLPPPSAVRRRRASSSGIRRRATPSASRSRTSATARRSRAAT